MCDLCQDRGFIIDDNKVQKKCVCTVKKELAAMLDNLVKYNLNKAIDYNKLNMNLTIIDGESDDFYSLIKSFLFKRFFNEITTKASYTIETGRSIVERYLESDMTFLYDIPLLFIDLTRFTSNKAMGEVINYTIEQRNFKDNLTWCYIKTMPQDFITEHYSKELSHLVFNQKAISLKAFIGDYK